MEESHPGTLSSQKSQLCLCRFYSHLAKKSYNFSDTDFVWRKKSHVAKICGGKKSHVAKMCGEKTPQQLATLSFNDMFCDFYIT